MTLYTTTLTDGTKLTAYISQSYWYPDETQLDLYIRQPGAPYSIPHHTSFHKTPAAAVRKMKSFADGWQSTDDIIANMKEARK